MQTHFLSVDKESQVDVVKIMSSAGPSSSYLPCKESTNYMRLCQLIVTICTDVLRCIFNKYIPPSTLHSTLNTNKCLLKGSSCHLSKQQKEILFPRGHTSSSSTDFDVSLLYSLLRNIAGITPHSNGWGNTPKLGDISVSACIETIRIARNNLNGHCLTGNISDADFNDIWSTLRSVVEEIETNELSGTSFVEAIDELYDADLDPFTSGEYIEEIKRMLLEENEVKKMILSFKGTFLTTSLLFSSYFYLLRITDESSVPEMRILSILLIKSDLKWCTHLSRSLFSYLSYLQIR